MTRIALLLSVTLAWPAFAHAQQITLKIADILPAGPGEQAASAFRALQ